jgi:hypothetical protein
VVRTGRMVSSAFTVWQREGPERKGSFVINFERQSGHWQKESVKMEMLPGFAPGLVRNVVLTSWKVKSGYRHFYLHPRMRDYFLFHYGGRFYRYVALPFGWGRSVLCFANETSRQASTEGVRLPSAPVDRRFSVRGYRRSSPRHCARLSPGGKTTRSIVPGARTHSTLGYWVLGRGAGAGTIGSPAGPATHAGFRDGPKDPADEEDVSRYSVVRSTQPTVGVARKIATFLRGGGVVDFGSAHGQVLYPKSILGHELGRAARDGRAKSRRGPARGPSRARYAKGVTRSARSARDTVDQGPAVAPLPARSGILAFAHTGRMQGLAPASCRPYHAQRCCGRGTRWDAVYLFGGRVTGFVGGPRFVADGRPASRSPYAS